ncbi:hypothetical protein KC952_04185 [Candidatus Saccharibacteria bacterium]|nr:hypothetical protein [Candidatus Saccharibacteria bacterium]
MNTQTITQSDIAQLVSNLPKDEVTTLVDHLNETLEERVGAEIAESLDDNQLAELLQVQDSNDAQAMEQWYTKNVTELEEIVADEKAILLGELAENANNISSAAIQPAAA